MVLLVNAEGALALMSKACEAVKNHRWEEAEGTLKKLQTFVHHLRVEIRDQGFPMNPAGPSGRWIGRMTQEETVAAELKAAGASVVLAMPAAENSG